jgi:hypothetical protein
MRDAFLAIKALSNDSSQCGLANPACACEKVGMVGTLLLEAIS